MKQETNSFRSRASNRALAILTRPKGERITFFILSFIYFIYAGFNKTNQSKARH